MFKDEYLLDFINVEELDRCDKADKDELEMDVFEQVFRRSLI